jgi:hypothetical protein
LIAKYSQPGILFVPDTLDNFNMRDIAWNSNLSLTKKCDKVLITKSEKFSKNFANCISDDSAGYTSQLQCFNM